MSTITDIKKEFRANMNGIASKYMRESGFNYHVNFGIELPRLRAIAAEFEADRSLAQQLWHENVRESKIVATMLMPIGYFDRDMADIWVDDIPNVEIAQVAVMNLFARLPYASDIAFEWMASANGMRQLCGILILARLLADGGEFNERAEYEFLDQSEAILRATMVTSDTPQNNGIALNTPLRRAVVNALNHYAASGTQQAARAQKILSVLA